MTQIIISNPQYFQETLQKIIDGKKDNLHIIADFDRTLTKAFAEGKPTVSLITRLQNGIFPPEYAVASNAIFNTYHPMEIDPLLPLDQKKQAMQKWRDTQFALMLSYGLTRNNIKQAMQSESTNFRPGYGVFFTLLNDNQIPLLILSASGLGYESIYYCLEHEKMLYENIDIISNAFVRDEDGKAIAIRQPIIHSCNKDETIVKNFPIYEDIKERKNILLLGDGVGDAHMADGFEYENILKIGFLNHDTPENRKQFQENFDLIILDDGPMDEINTMLKKIIG